MNNHTEYSYIINGRSAGLNDPTPTPRQLLVSAGFEPAEDYALIALAGHGTKVLSADDVIDLREKDAEFFAFLGGALFQATINDHSIWWGKDSIDIATLRRIGRVNETDNLVWVRPEGQNEVLPQHGDFVLRLNGIEHLKTVARSEHEAEYHFFIDSQKYSTKAPELTGAQIMAMIDNWNPENSLVLESEGNDPDEVIRPTSVVSFKDRHGVAHFSIVPPATFGVA
jgi:hypothetical protein